MPLALFDTFVASIGFSNIIWREWTLVFAFSLHLPRCEKKRIEEAGQRGGR